MYLFLFFQVTKELITEIRMCIGDSGNCLAPGDEHGTGDSGNQLT